MRNRPAYGIVLFIILSPLWLAADEIQEALDRIAWFQFKTLPIQSGGRVQPLDTFARNMLLQFSGKNTVQTDAGRLSAIQWLVLLLLDGKSSKEYPIFLVENPEILDDLGIPYTKPRDRYSYNELSPGRARLKMQVNRIQAEAAQQTRIQAEAAQQTRIQSQMQRLDQNLREFETILYTFVFLEINPESSRMTGIVGSLIFHFLYLENFRMANESPLTISPPQTMAEKQWMPPCRLQFAEKERLVELSRMVRAFREGNWEAVNQNLGTLHQKILETARKRGEAEHIEWEVRYNEYNPFFYALIFYLAALSSCAFSWMGWGSKKFYIIALAMLAVGFAAHSMGISMRIIVTGRPPVCTLYETIIFTAWAGMVLGFVLEWSFYRRLKTISLAGGLLLAVVLLFIARKYSVERDSMGVMQAVLDSNFWLSTHVTTITIGFSACLLAGAVGHIFVLLHLFVPALAERRREEMYRMIYGSVAFACVFAFLGTVLGGMWGGQSWGRFWGWDPKENGALLIVLWNILLLHARGKYIKEWGMALGAIFGNIIVAAAWWGVNLLNVGLHSYGSTSGATVSLAIFTAIELVFIVIGATLAYVAAQK